MRESLPRISCADKQMNAAAGRPGRAPLAGAGPGAGLGAGLTAYFGVTMVWLAARTVTGTWAQHGFGSYPSWFFWVSVPGYLA